MSEISNSNLSQININQELNLSVSNREDFVQDIFKIHIHHEVKELSNEFVKYFLSTHSETNEEHYAIIFDRKFCPNIECIKSIARSPENLFVKPVAGGYTKISSTKIFHLAIIVKKFNPDNNLYQEIKKGNINSRIINNKLIPFFSKAVGFSTNNKFSIGNINPKNILIYENEYILREPYISLPHFYQEDPYLSIELLDAHPAGRTLHSSCTDMYAIGVSVLQADNSDLDFSKITDNIKFERYKNSSFFAITSRSKVRENLKPFIRGCMSDSITERWRHRHIEDWISGKLTEFQHLQIGDQISPISFNNNNYSNFRSLASAMFNNWEAAQNFIYEERLVRWVQRSFGKNKEMEYIHDLLTKDSSTVTKFVSKLIDKDDKLFKIIQALDNQGPIRYCDIGVFITSFPELFLFAMNRGDQKIIDTIIKLINRKKWEYLYKINPDVDYDDKYISRLASINNFYDSKIIPFSKYRVLYSLNPDLPCLSPMIISNYITNLNDLLLLLEKIAEEQPEKLRFDDQLIGFISEKINLRKEVFLNTSKNLPNLISGSPSYGLAVLSAASKEIKIRMPKLAKYFEKYLIDIIEEIINNKKVKITLIEKINKAASESDLLEMNRIISNKEIFHSDQTGYFKAVNEINLLEKRIKMLSNNNKISNYGSLFGQRITVLVSYILLVIIGLSVIL